MPLTTDRHTADNRAAIRSGSPALGRIAIVTADQVEDIEFFYPYYRFAEEGYDVDVLTPDGGDVVGYKGLTLRTGTTAIKDADPSSYDAVFIPGGLAPAEVRNTPEAITFVQEFSESGKLIGAVCHGPQVLVTAGLVEGRRMTSWQEVAGEIRSAGGEYVDDAVVEDGQFITARKPGDMPLEMARIFARLRNTDGPAVTAEGTSK